MSRKAKQMMEMATVVSMLAVTVLAAEVGPRTDWSGRGRDGQLDNPANWSAGLPNDKTVCVVKKGGLKLGDEAGLAPAVTCMNMTFQEGSDMSLYLRAGTLTLTGSDSRWPNSETLDVQQTGGEVSAGTLMFAVKPGSVLNYEMSGGALKANELRTGAEGAARFNQSGGAVDVRNFYVGWNAGGTTDYVLSGGTLNFEKLVVGNRGGSGGITLSGSAPVVGGIRLEVTETGSLTFIQDATGVASFGTADQPVKQAILAGTLSFQTADGASPVETVKLIYANNLNAGKLKLDRKTSAAWEITQEQDAGVSVLCLKAK